jgi:hypothetical protein
MYCANFAGARIQEYRIGGANKSKCIRSGDTALRMTTTLRLVHNSSYQIAPCSAIGNPRSEYFLLFFQYLVLSAPDDMALQIEYCVRAMPVFRFSRSGLSWKRTA